MATLVENCPASSRLHRLLALGAAVASLFCATAARAEAAAEPPDAGADTAKAAASSEPASQHPQATRRSGFTMSASLGPSLGRAAGFPNDTRKIGRTPYYTETAVGGGLATGWIGVALSDWLTFGLGGTYGWVFGGDAQVESAGILFRVEAFPLWPVGGVFRDIGLNLNSGVGLLSATSADNPEITLINGGLASWIGVGAFYEGIRLWRLSMGPFAVYDYMWSASVKLPVATIGWRTTLYVGP